MVAIPWKSLLPSGNLSDAALIQKEIKFSSYIRKFRMEQLQSHILLTASSYMGKYLHISSILGSPSSYMNLQLLHAKFPYIWGTFDFLSVVDLRGPILSAQAGHQLSIYCIKELFGRNSPHLASVNSAYKESLPGSQTGRSPAPTLPWGQWASLRYTSFAGGWGSCGFQEHSLLCE